MDVSILFSNFLRGGFVRIDSLHIDLVIFQEVQGGNCMTGTKLKPVEGWDKQKIKALFLYSADVELQEYKFEEGSTAEVILIYSGGLCDSSQIAKVILPELVSLYAPLWMGSIAVILGLICLATPKKGLAWWSIALGVIAFIIPYFTLDK